VADEQFSDQTPRMSTGGGGHRAAAECTLSAAGQTPEAYDGPSSTPAPYDMYR